jgi:hypothetical protein
MKQLKQLANKALMFTVSVLIVALIFTLLAQLISLTFYTIVFVGSVLILGYLYFRDKHDSSTNSPL